MLGIEASVVTCARSGDEFFFVLFCSKRLYSVPFVGVLL